MIQPSELVLKKIAILKGYFFFNDFMDADSPDSKKFLGNLKPFLKDLRKRGFNNKELKLLQHLVALSTYPKEKRYAMLERWLTAEMTSEFISIDLIKNPLSKDLRRFYKDIYESTFAEDERESLKNIRGWILGENWFPSRIVHWWDSRKYRNFFSHVVHPRYYVLLVKIKGIVVGGAFVNTINTEYISFMVIDFFLITLQHLSEIEELKEFSTGEYKVKLATALFERCKYYAVKDAIRYGHKQPFFILGQASDPVKMYHKHILNLEHDTENPAVRLRLYSIMGFKFLDFPYVSPALGEDQKAVDYEYEIMYSLNPEWRNEVDPKIYKYALVTFLGTWADVTKEPVKGMIDYLDNLITQGKKIRLMNFAELRIPREIISICKQIRWKVEA